MTKKVARERPICVECGVEFDVRANSTNETCSIECAMERIEREMERD